MGKFVLTIIQEEDGFDVGIELEPEFTDAQQIGEEELEEIQIVAVEVAQHLNQILTPRESDEGRLN